MSQVSGRAGRRGKEGKVIIQTSQPSNPVIQQVINHNYATFFEFHLHERRKYHYPPFCRMFRIIVKDRQRGASENAAWFLAAKLRVHLAEKVLGPETPSIERINNYYLREIMLKIPKDYLWTEIRSMILNCITQTKQQEGIKSVRIAVDVDPN
jgi:primosomal protein N' (replication factor Y)